MLPAQAVQFWGGRLGSLGAPEVEVLLLPLFGRTLAGLFLIMAFWQGPGLESRQSHLA